MNDSVHKVGHGNHHAQKHTFGKAKHSGGMPKVIPKTQDAVKTATDRAIIRYVGGKVPGDSGPVKRAAADIWKRYQLLKHGGAQCFASAIGSSDAVIPEGCQDILRAATEIAEFEDALDQLQQHLDETFPGKGYGRYIQHIKTALIAEASHLKSSTINFVRLAVAVSFQESSFNPKLVSGQNAMGVMQLQGPTAIMVLAMMPPSASISRTRWPLATPPTAGLQLIWAIRSRFMVTSAVLSPMRAAAIAASQPA